MSVPSAPVPRWTLGDRLRKARENAGFSQAALARETGIPARSIGRYETGTTKPSRPQLLAWSIATEVPLEWLTGDDGNHPDDDDEFRKGRILTPPVAA
jgi:transcriptional regulator with XRE-family HTH domain